MSAFKKILCPTDFSEASYEALNKAVELAASDNCEICVLHIEPAAGEVSALAGYAPSARAEADRRAETVQNLCAVLEERVPPTVSTKPALKQGEAGAQIVQSAIDESADLIVITTHGAGGLVPGELGRVATFVVQSAPCPVLTINRRNETPLEPAYTEVALKPEFHIAHASPNALFLDGD